MQIEWGGIKVVYYLRVILLLELLVLLVLRGEGPGGHSMLVCGGCGSA